MLLKRRRYIESDYHHKCPRCSYYFTEKLPACPLCEKEGVKVSLRTIRIVG